MKDHECSRETIHSCVDYSIAAVRAGLKELVESKVLRQEGIGRKAKYSLISDAEDRVAT